MIHKWPDGTPKSMHNAFNWRENSLGILCVKPTPIPERSKDMTASSSIYSYGKDPKKSTAPHTVANHGKGKMFTVKKENP